MTAILIHGSSCQGNCYQFNFTSMKSLHMVTFILLIVGGLNLGLSSLGYNVLDMILGAESMLLRVIYFLIGFSAVYEIISHRRLCRECFRHQAQ